MKFQLRNSSDSPIQSPTNPLWLLPQKLSPLNTTTNEVSTIDTGTNSESYRFDPSTQQYIYNWSTKGVTAGYWYRVFAKLDDGTIRSVVVGVR